MYRILTKEILAPKIFRMEVEAPLLAKSALPGQFLAVIIDDKGERVPLTICDYDSERGIVEIVAQVVGKSSAKMMEMEVGDCFRNVVGPLGNPSDFVEEPIEELKKKKLLFVAGGVGTAPVYPQVKWLKEHGIGADVILGAKNKDFVILEEKLGSVSENLYVCTDDGSYGFSGMVTKYIDELIVNQKKHYDRCVAIGPMIMMKFVVLTADKYNLETIVSMNPIMVDCTGMCGACRILVGDETKFACVDGPEFVGQMINWDLAMKRSAQYKAQESASMEEYLKGRE